MNSKCLECGKKYCDSSSLRRNHYRNNPSHIPDSWEKCNQCGKKFSVVARHWSLSPECDFPSVSEKLKKISVGILMGDGSIHKGKLNHSLRCRMINKEYLNYIDDSFGILSNGVKFYASAKESAAQNRKYGFRPHAKSENYSDLYRWETKAHPLFTKMREWYKTGEKVWPDDIDMNPLTLKHWYVGDGNYDTRRSNRYIQINLTNERKNKNKIRNMFEEKSLPIPKFNEYQKKSGGWNCFAYWNVQGTKRLFEYMGNPLPGFKYKWPKDKNY